MARASLGLGSNLGDRSAHLRYALGELARCGEVLARSPLIETAPVDCPEGGPFLNACVTLETTLSPRRLLTAAMRIERARGRRRKVRNEPRVLDIDILLYGDSVIAEPALDIPHPLMHQRTFVLEPLAMIAPRAIHPVLRCPIRELASRSASTRRRIP